MIKLKNKNGITMISLLVSIIVILILITINISITLDPEKGVIKKAQDTVDQNKIAEEKELIEATWYKLYQTKSVITVNDLLIELQKNNSNWMKESGQLKSPYGNKYEVNSHECIINLIN